jgi:hypothetical protein
VGERERKKERERERKNLNLIYFAFRFFAEISERKIILLSFREDHFEK